MDLAGFLTPSPQNAIVINLLPEEMRYLKEHGAGSGEAVLFQAGPNEDCHLIACIQELGGNRLTASAAAVVRANSPGKQCAPYEVVTGMRRLQRVPSGGARVKSEAIEVLLAKPSTRAYSVYFV